MKKTKLVKNAKYWQDKYEWFKVRVNAYGKEIKEERDNALKDLELYKDIANQWREDYDKLQAKYEPKQVVVDGWDDFKKVNKKIEKKKKVGKK